MIPGAPDSIDLRAAIAMEQVVELTMRTDWDDLLPIVLILDEDFEVIHQHIIEDGQRHPALWVENYRRLYGALFDLASALIVTYKVATIVEDDTITGEPIITEDGVDPGGCVGHRHEEARLVALFSKDRPTASIFIDRKTNVPEWGTPEMHEGELIDTFEALIAGWE